MSVEKSATAVSVARPKRNKYALGCAMLASMTAIFMDYNNGVLSGAGRLIESDIGINDTQLEILNGIVNLFALLGSVLAGRMSDKVGRRLTIVFAAVVFFAGALISALAPGFAALLVGRFFTGIGIGYGLVIAPVYAAEVAPASARGFLSSLPEVFDNAGILCGYISNLVFSGLPIKIGWRVMFAIGLVPPMFLAAGVLVMPESPRWLVMQGRTDDARRVLDRTSESPEEAELRLKEIEEAAQLASTDSITHDPTAPLLKKNNIGKGVWRELFISPSPHIRRVLIAGIGLQFFQQASGIDSVVLYSVRVFENAGIKSETGLLIAQIAVGVSKTGFILVAMFLADKVGRRPLLLCSAGGMVASLVILSSGLMLINQNPNEEMMWASAVCIAMVVCFVASFSIGLGPLPWVYTSEIFPLRLRAQGASLAAVVNRVMSAAVTMTFISLYKAITIAGSFYFYAGICAMAWIFIYKLLPETRGRTLEEMEEIFSDEKSGRAAQKSRRTVPCDPLVRFGISSNGIE